MCNVIYEYLSGRVEGLDELLETPLGTDPRMTKAAKQQRASQLQAAKLEQG